MAAMINSRRRLLQVALGAGLLAGSAMMLTGCAGSGGSAASQLANPAVTSPSTAQSRQNVTAKVALLLPLTATGQPAVVAKAMKQAAELALFENKAAGFQLVVKDTKGTAAGATAAATEALAGGAELIVGPLFATSVSATSAVARQAKVPVIAFSNDRRVAGGGTYLLSFMVQEEVQRIVRFAAQQGKRQYAALIPESDYGRLVEAAFRSAVAQSGGVVVALRRYPPGYGGILSPARKLIDDIQASEGNGIYIDALFAPGGPDVISSLGPVITQQRLDVSRIKLIGLGGWDYPNISREKAFVGGWYPAPDPRGWRAFAEKFSQSFGTSPPRVASLAHNAMTIAIRLAGSHAKGQRYTAANLTRPGGFLGADGIVRFTNQGVTQRGLAVLEVRAFGPQVVSPAPQTFSSTPATLAPASTGSVRYN